MANLGHFEIEVIIEPVYPNYGGGGWSPAPLGSATDKYIIRIRVRRKDKTWEYETVVRNTTAKVVAKLIGKKIDQPIVELVNTSMVENTTPTIKVTVK